jgi:hypothetical protein
MQEPTFQNNLIIEWDEKIDSDLKSMFILLYLYYKLIQIEL